MAKILPNPELLTPKVEAAHHFPKHYEESIPESDNPSGMYCPDCRYIGVSHCADPENCGGMIKMREPTPIESRFICLEGMDYSGKSTIVAMLSKHFEDQGIPYIRTREPGGCEMAETLRSLVLDNSTVLTPMSELLLFMAARNEHLHTVIIPALHAGKVVLCDRWLGSSFIYQGLGKKLGTIQVNTVFTALLRSNTEYPIYLDHHIQTFVLDISHGVAMERAAARGEAANRLDVTGYQQFTEQRIGYKSLPDYNDLFKHDFHIIDAEGSPSSIAKTILQLAKGNKHE